MRRHRNSKTTFAILLLAITLVAGACGGDGDTQADTPSTETGEPQPGGELVIGRLGDIESWNPDEALATQTYQTLPQVYETLIRFGADNQSIEPALAESWEFDEDDLTFTFHLRSDLKFSDGSPLTSEDVKFSLEQAQAGPGVGFVYAAIDTIDAVDNRTVVVRLNEFDSALEAYFTYPAASIVPNNYGGMNAEEFFANPIGAGPFKIESWTPGDEMILVRNEHYWDEGKPYLDRVVQRVFSGENERLLAFEAGDIDLVEVVTKGLEGQLDSARTLWVEPTAVVDEIIVNHTVEPLDDENVRRAISLAIDRQQIVDGLLEGRGRPAQGALTPELLHSVGASEPWQSDREAAREALAASTVPEGFQTTILVDRSQAFPEVIQAVQQQLGEIGIDVEIVTTDANTWIDALIAGDYELLDLGLKNFLPEVIETFQLYSITEGFFSGVDTSVAEEQVATYKSTTSHEERDAAVRAFEDWVQETTALVPMVSWDHAFAISERVQGFSPVPTLLYPLEEVWLSGS